MPSDPQRVQAVFVDAVQKSESERAEFLNRECAGDSELRRRVEALIKAHEQTGSFLDSPPKDLAGTSPTVAPTITERAGSLIGPFKLLQQIGEGGMGSVYMAEQIEPVERRVALKIIKPGMDTKTVIARFEAERQALAMMDHPNIAKVIDVGTTNSGRPYFVMELVRGVPITQYCDEHHLSPRERLELFLPVCQAVQHAHQKGIIHRDIKPSNVMVAEYDDKPVPKIIDFGLAKAMEKRLTAKTMFTEFGQIVGTPDYMSPEQARLNQMDIDTRSDIYSLGVLLYELLSGNTPFDRQRMRSAAFDELLRIIREEEPPRPSQRLSTVDTLPSIAANRHITPAELTRQLSGELDWIVMKTLEKDRSRRYDTANGLASDLRRYLNNEPVEACPPSTAYRFRKFARRNKGPLTVATTVAAALILLVIVSLFAASRFRSLARHNASLVVQKQDALTAEITAKNAARDAQHKAEIARAQEQNLRTEAQQQRDRAENHKQVAQNQRSLAEERELLARRNLYAAHMNLAYDAWEETDIPRTVDFLKRHVPLPGEPDWRSFEWYYLAGLCNRDVLTIPVHHSWSRPAFSPDGKILAVSVYNRQIELWDLSRREPIKIFDDTTVEGPLAFSPDGTLLASTGSGELRLRDANTGELIHSMPGHAHHMETIAFTPDGSKIISTDGGNLDSKNIPGIIRVWDVETGERVYELTGHTKYIYSIAVSPDGNQLVSVGENEVRFWDLRTGQAADHKGIRSNRAVAWSPLGGSIATFDNGKNSNGQILVWDSTSGRQTSGIDAPGLNTLAFSPDGLTLASAQSNGTVALWEIETGKQLARYKGHSQWLFHVVFSPDGEHVASVGRDCQLKVWAVENDQRIATISGSHNRSYQEPGRDRVALSPDGKSLAGLRNDGKTIVLVDVSSGRELSSFDVGARVHAIAFSPAGQRLAVAHEAGLQLWNASNARLERDFSSNTEFWTLAFTPDGRSLAAGNADRRVDVYDAESLEKQLTLPWQYATHLRKLAWSPDGKSLAAGTIGVNDEEALIHMWDMDQRRLRFSLPLYSRSLTDLEFSPDGRMLAVSEGSFFLPQDGAATSVFDTTTGEKLATLRGGAAAHMAVAFANAGETLATATDEGKVTLWDLNTLEERMTFGWDFPARGKSGLYSSSVESLLFSPDDRTLISSDSRAKVRLWRGARPERVAQIEQAGRRRRATEYAREGRWQKAVDLSSESLRQDNDPTARRNRARCFAQLGRWDEAVADFEQLVAREPRNFRAWFKLALARLIGGDRSGYERTCAEMFDQFQLTQDATAANKVSWTQTLAPQPDADWARLLSLAAVPFFEGEAGASAHQTLAAVLLRAGLYEDALAELDAAAESVKQEANLMHPEYQNYLRALAHARLGNDDLARIHLARAEAIGRSAVSPAGDSESSGSMADTHELPWVRLATCRIFRSELNELLRREMSADVDRQLDRSQRALDVYTRAIELRSDIPILYRLRGSARERLGRFAEARDDFATLAELKEQFPVRRLNRLADGQRAHRRNAFWVERICYYIDRVQDYDNAIKDCYIVLQNSNTMNDANVFNLLFRAHELRGTLDDAEGDWRRNVGEAIPEEFYQAKIVFDYKRRFSGLIPRTPKGEYADWERIVSTQFGGWHWSAGKFADKLLAQNPHHQGALLERAWARLMWGAAADTIARNSANAVTDCTEAIRLGLDNRWAEYWAYQRRSVGYLKLGQFDEAIRDAEAAIRIEPKFPYAYANLAVAQMEQKQWTDAINNYRQWVKLSDDQAPVWCRSTKSNLFNIACDDQSQDLDEAIRVAPAHPWTRKDRSKYSLFGDSREWNLSDCDELIALAPNAAWGYYLRAKAYLKLKNYDQAISSCEEAIRISPSYHKAHVLRAETCLARGDDEQVMVAAEELLDACLNQFTYKRAVAVVAKASQQCQQPDRTAALYSKLIRFEPEKARFWRTRGEAWRDAGRYEDAISDYDEAIRISPKDAMIYKRRGQASFALGKYETAIADFNTAIRLGPSHARHILPHRGMAHAKLTQLDQAADDLRQGLKLDPEQKWILRHLLDVEFARGASNETMATIIAEDDTSELSCMYAAWKLYLNRQDEYEQACHTITSRFAQSERHWELYLVARVTAITRNPVLETGRLVEIADRAVKSCPNAWYLYTSGLCLLRDGQEEAAIERFNESLGKDWHGAPASWLGLAIAHSAVGQAAEAKDWLGKAQEWFGEHPLDISSELHTHDRLDCQLLLREAEERIEQTSVDRDVMATTGQE